MKKANSKNDYNYNSAFPSILRTLLDERKTTQEELASFCGVQRQSVAQWKDGNTRPDIGSLQKISEFFDVSTDYLLGIVKNPTTDKELNAVCEFIGLSEGAIVALQSLKNKSEFRSYSDLLSCIIEEDNFEYFLGLLEGYIEEDQNNLCTDLSMSRVEFCKKDLSIFAAGNCLRNMLDLIAPKFNKKYKTTDERLKELQKKMTEEENKLLFKETPHGKHN